MGRQRRRQGGYMDADERHAAESQDLEESWSKVQTFQ